MNATSIVGWPRSRTPNTIEIRFPGERREDGLDQDAVLPAVAEIVDVRKLGTLTEAEVVEASQPSIFRRLIRVLVLGTWFQESPLGHLELVQM